MADDIDVANDLMDVQISRALSKLRQSSGNGKVVAEHCRECGDDMPAARKEMGFTLCVACAEESERRGQMYAG